MKAYIFGDLGPRVFGKNCWPHTNHVRPLRLNDKQVELSEAPSFKKQLTSFGIYDSIFYSETNLNPI